MHEWELIIKIKHISESDRGKVMRYINNYLTSNKFENEMIAVCKVDKEKQKQSFIQQLLNWWKI